MSRKKVSVSIGPSKPRNRVVQAIIGGIGGLATRGVGRHKLTHLKRGQSKNRIDLNQRVLDHAD